MESGFASFFVLLLIALKESSLRAALVFTIVVVAE